MLNKNFIQLELIKKFFKSWKIYFDVNFILYKTITYVESCYICIYSCGRDESFPNQVLSSSKMTLSLNPQGFTQSHIGERCLSPLPYKDLV